MHKADINNVFFSFRGKSHRTSALENAIKKAQQNFINKYKIESIKPVRIQSCYPFENVGLQVIDYCLWTLQRLYEKHEDRFYNLLSNKFKLIMDLDDKRNNEYGEWYNERNILKIKKLLKS